MVVHPSSTLSSENCCKSPTLPAEAEWLATTLSEFVDLACGIDGSLQLLTSTICPVVVPDLAQPIPVRWKLEQSLTDVVKEFPDFPDPVNEGLSRSAYVRPTSGSDTAPTTDRSEIRRGSQRKETAIVTHLTVRKSSSSYETPTRSPFVYASATDRKPLCSSYGDTKSRSQRERRCSTENRSDDLTSRSETLHRPSRLRYEQTSSAPYQHRMSDPSRHFLSSNDESAEQFGRRWFLASLQRLKLPEQLVLQMQRLHSLARPPVTASVLRALEAEKNLVKAELKDYDMTFATVYGSLPSRHQKEPLRPLYAYYRRVKTALERCQNHFSKEDGLHADEFIEFSYMNDVSNTDRHLARSLPPTLHRSGQKNALPLVLHKDNHEAPSSVRLNYDKSSRNTSFSCPNGVKRLAQISPQRGIRSGNPCEKHIDAQNVSLTARDHQTARMDSRARQGSHPPTKQDSRSRACNYPAVFPTSRRHSHDPSHRLSDPVSGTALSHSLAYPSYPDLDDLDVDTEKKRLQKLQEEKAHIRRKLEQFQREFVRVHRRPILYHRDILHVEHEYKQYKQLKDHIQRFSDTLRRRATIHHVSHSDADKPF